ncbi:MAG: NAD-dependent epimerase/dehydratase family protein [Nitrospirae bacterium]|nr:NAD-dependent epimerase/dehydratase family protein [Nitrospirota bacterium]
MTSPAPSLPPDTSAFFTGKRILITGGRGYIATRLLRQLRQVECRILRLARRDGEPPETASPSGAATVVDLPGDVREPSIWMKALEDVEIIFHLAAQTSTYVANENPEADHEANVAPMLRLLESCRRSRLAPVIIFSGTVTAVGIPQTLPVDETHADHPITVYDLHKLMAESYLKYYSEQGIARGVILRLSNVYGPGPRSSKPDRGILNSMVRRALQGEALTVYGEGNLLRDYVFVDDVAQALLRAAQNADTLAGRHFIVSSGTGHTLTQAADCVAARVAAKTGRTVPVRHVPPPHLQSPIEARNFVGNPKRFSDATGWAPVTSLPNGIDHTIEAAL